MWLVIPCYWLYHANLQIPDRSASCKMGSQVWTLVVLNKLYYILADVCRCLWIFWHFSTNDSMSLRCWNCSVTVIPLNLWGGVNKSLVKKQWTALPPPSRVVLLCNLKTCIPLLKLFWYVANEFCQAFFLIGLFIFLTQLNSLLPCMVKVDSRCYKLFKQKNPVSLKWSMN